jgi:hypothetical protein
VVVKGAIRGNGRQLADYLLSKRDNDSVALFDIRGTAHPDDLVKSLVEMSLTSELSGRTSKGLYHVQINPDPAASYRMTAAQWIRAAEIIEEQTGFTGQKRIMVLHEKDNRLHMHVAWERYDHDTGKMISNKHSRLAQNRGRIQMEREFGHTLTPERNLRRPELQKLITGFWHRTPDGDSFAKALPGHGLTIVRTPGRRDLAAVDEVGRSYNLVPLIKGIKTKEVRARMKGVDLQSEKATIKAIRERQRTDREKLLQMTERQRQIEELKQKFHRKQDHDRDR